MDIYFHIYSEVPTSDCEQLGLRIENGRFYLGDQLVKTKNPPDVMICDGLILAAMLTGEERPPLAGEWCISNTAMSMAHRVVVDENQPFRIAKLVIVKPTLVLH